MSPVRSCCCTSLSAKSLTEVPDPTADGMSFTYRRNSSGPNTVLPCGTPEVTGEYSDFTPSHTTIWWWFMRKDSIQRRTLPWIPYRRSLLKRRLRGTVSKALLKSSIPKSTWRFASRCLSSSCVVRRSCVSQEWSLQKPWLAGVNILLSSRCPLVCVHKMCSASLHTIQVSDAER